MFSTTSDTNNLSPLTSAQPCRRFSLEEIQFATNDFDEELVIGHGGFGKVYRGQICSNEGDHVVAIKRMDMTSSQGEPEFKAEIQILSKLRHRHLVSLVGFCNDNTDLIVVYKYMPHGTLEQHLHKAKTPLRWVQRLKIALGAARGLNYLHTGVGTQQEVIHRDVKSSNILLDEEWEAMISDFGLSKLRPTNQPMSYLHASIKGTFGYIDPEYFNTGKLTTKTDVYAFGVVLFELLSERLAVDERYGEDQRSLVKWAQKCVKDRKLDQMVDANIRGTIATKCLRGFTKIADRCVSSDPKERPSMTEVVASLQTLLELQEKADISAMLPRRMCFNLRIIKCLVPAIKLNSDESGKSSQKSQPQELIMARDVKVFTYGELNHATRNFSSYRCLGSGSNGSVYRGWLNNTAYPSCYDYTGSPIAVKRLVRDKFFDLETFVKFNHPNQLQFDLENVKEFYHPNLVQLIGYCIYGEDLLLVSEYMCNGSFNVLLDSGVVEQLPLVTKMKIAVGIARGIVFLTEAQLRVREMRKTYSGSLIARQNILFDEDFTAKISGYECPISVHGSFDDTPNVITVPSNLKGFTALFEEVVTGNILKKNTMSKSAKRSLGCIAKLCSQICNDVDAESKMLAVMEKHEKHFPEWGISNCHPTKLFHGIMHNDLRKQDMEKDNQISCLAVTIILVGYILIGLSVPTIDHLYYCLYEGVASDLFLLKSQLSLLQHTITNIYSLFVAQVTSYWYNS
ncbi:hypothetical protein QVD17_27602 [Tagetes erecta]|uniref:Protein kinase domain-containing protein n=1 Tax=Tagetes erecta TaxID=13708 RepID=A0AAD8NRJ2_TARER|nr:hypothetical protein QVD17_27602 [Tagetes erecta]